MTQENKTKLDSFLNSELDLREIIYVLWSKRLFILVTTFISTLIFCIYAYTIPNQYTAESTLEIHNNSETSGALSSLTNQLGGLASLAGINVGGGQSGDKSFWVMERLRSKEFSRHISLIGSIKENFLAIESFDQKSSLIKYNERVFINNEWLIDSEGSSEPTALEFHNAMNSSFSVKKNTETGFIELSFQRLSPVFANEFLNIIIEEINTLTKKEDKKNAQNSLDYLKSVLSKNSIKDVKRSVNELIKNQLNVIMLADINDFYILKPIDPPYVPEQKSLPSRSLIGLMGIFLGGIFGSIFVLIRHYRIKK